MKKLLFILSFCFLAFMGHSQEIGARFGDALGNNVAIDAVFGTGPSRIHADLTFGNRGVGLEILWDVIYDQLGTSDLNWYLGVGPSALIGDKFLFGLAGELGLEWRIPGAPLVLGGDWRPVLVVVDRTDMDWNGFGFNMRFVF